MKETTANALSLKEQWDSYQVRIEELEDLRDEMGKALRSIHRNIDYNHNLDSHVEMWLTKSQSEISLTLTQEEFNWQEEIAYVADCVADCILEDSETSEEERVWFLEDISYNIRELSYSKSLDVIVDKIEKLKDEQFDLIRSKYLAAYENACDDLYYGYGYKTWAEGTAYVEGHRQLFDSEEDAKFVWHLAFEKMANDED